MNKMYDLSDLNLFASQVCCWLRQINVITPYTYEVLEFIKGKKKRKMKNKKSSADFAQILSCYSVVLIDNLGRL